MKPDLEQKILKKFHNYINTCAFLRTEPNWDKFILSIIQEVREEERNLIIKRAVKHWKPDTENYQKLLNILSKNL